MPTLKEIKDADFALNPDSTPGPDGFTGIFVRTYWDLIENNLVQAV